MNFLSAICHTSPRFALVVCLCVIINAGVSAIAQELPLEGATKFMIRDTTSDFGLGGVASSDFIFPESGDIYQSVAVVTYFLGSYGYSVADGIASDYFSVDHTGNYRIRMSGAWDGRIIEGSTSGITGVSKAGGIMTMRGVLSNGEADYIAYETDFSSWAYFEEAASVVSEILGGGPTPEEMIQVIADHILPKAEWENEPFGLEFTAYLQEGSEYKWLFFVHSNIACGGVGIVYEAACYTADIHGLTVELEYLDAPRPDPPTGVTASKGVAFEDYYVRVMWSPPMTGADGYDVFRNITDNPTSAIKIASGSGTLYEDSNVDPGVTYYYWVRSRNLDPYAVSDLSASYDYGYLGSDIEVVLPPPTNLVATTGDYSHKIRLTWNNDSSDPEEDGYEVWKNTTPELSSAYRIDSLTDDITPSYDDTLVEIGRPYYYWVRATLDAPPVFSGFSACASGMAGEPFPEEPYEMSIFPKVLSLCGDSVAYELKPKMYEEYSVCPREGMTIIWSLSGCEGAWLEYDGDSVGQLLTVISNGEDCEDGPFPLLKYKGVDACIVAINLSISGYYYWDETLNLPLNPLCPPGDIPIYSIDVSQIVSDGKIEFDSSGHRLVIPTDSGQYNDFNNWTALMETRYFATLCTFEEQSDSRTISPSGDYVFTVRDRWDYYHFLWNAADCQQDNVCNLKDADVVQWSPDATLVACNTVDGYNDEIRLVNPTNCTLVHTFLTPFDDYVITDIDWRGNKLAAVGGDLRQVSVFNTTEGQYGTLWQYDQAPCQSWLASCAFNSDASKLAVLWELESQNDCTIENLVIFDAGNGAILNQTMLDSPHDDVSDISWSPDDTKLLVVGYSSFARILDANSFEQIIDLDIAAESHNVWCDWSSNDIIAVRDGEGVKFFTPFDMVAPSFDICVIDHGSDDWIADIEVNIDELYSLNLDSILVRVNNGDWTTIFEATYGCAFDSAAWNFTMSIPVSGGSNHIEFKAMDRRGNWGHESLDIIFDGVEDLHGLGLPEAFELHQNYPNPFNPDTRIEFGIPRTCSVRLDIYNILGEKVRTLLDQTMTAGYKVVIWDGKNDQRRWVSSGVYFYRLVTDEFTSTKKMLLIK